VSLEGELRLALRLQAGRVVAVDLRSSRPDIASLLLQGRRVADVQAAVPRLFSVCARSQAVACRLACAAAAGVVADAAALDEARAALAEETVRETAWQALLQLPRWMDEAPAPEAMAAARAARAWRCGDPERGDEDTAAATIAQAVFGCSAHDWLALTTWAAVADWAAAGGTATARYLHTLARDAADTGAPTPLLPVPTPAWLADMAAAAAADPDCTRRPLWQGRPAETGALARLQGDALPGSGTAGAASRPLARHLARLRELALLLRGRCSPGLGASTLAPGSGVAWADNARGLLLHHVQSDGERVLLYRIVAPTEWNFHPQGALAAALLGAPADSVPALRQRALRLVNSLDPCVSCTVEVTDA
jgi:coenzyme F420-reducing hydrogenase alpha subunit